MNSVLVTGGCGFIGYALTQRLLLEGYTVDVIDNLSIGKEAKDISELGANFLGGDVRAMDNIPDKPYKCIFHLAALSRIQPSFKSPSWTFSVNVGGTRKVVEYALRNGSKLIYSGSSSKTSTLAKVSRNSAPKLFTTSPLVRKHSQASQ